MLDIKGILFSFFKTAEFLVGFQTKINRKRQFLVGFCSKINLKMELLGVECQLKGKLKVKIIDLYLYFYVFSTAYMQLENIIMKKTKLIIKMMFFEDIYFYYYFYVKSYIKKVKDEKKRMSIWALSKPLCGHNRRALYREAKLDIAVMLVSALF